MWIAFAWLACDAPDANLDPCRPGFSLGPDGHCYPPPPRYPDPSATDALDGLPDCVELPAGDSLDLASGCVGEICVDDRFDTIAGILGTPTCAAVTATTTECDYGEGVLAAFVPATGGTAVPAADDLAVYLRVRAPFAGASEQGLGIDITPRCFVEQLGVPDRLVYEQIAGELAIFELRYDVVGPDAGLVVRDQVAGNQNRPDGTVDNLFLLSLD